MCAENSNDSGAKEPSNAFIENLVCNPVCDNSESPECLEHMTEINNNLNRDREENTTVINTDKVNATEVTNEIRNENIKQSDEEQKSHDLVNLLLCNDKNGNLDEVDASEVPKNVEKTKRNEVNFQMSDNNVQQSDAREVIIGITSSEEDKEQSRISMSVDNIINSLERSEPINKYLDGDDSKKQVSENNQITESIMRRMDEFSESNTVDSMELYWLRQSNIDLPASVSATTETDSDEDQIVIWCQEEQNWEKKLLFVLPQGQTWMKIKLLLSGRTKVGKKGKDQRKCELMSDSQ